MDRHRRTTVIILVACTAYAVVRYHVCKGVPWADLPLHTLNKAIALSALALFTLAAWRRGHGDERDVPAFRDGAWLMLAHVALSLCILTPVYYGKLFNGGKLTLAASLSLLTGAVATLIAWRSLRGCGPAGCRGAVVPLALPLCLGLHAALLGDAGWFTPSAWPGRMVPITLISTVLALALLAGNARWLQRV